MTSPAEVRESTKWWARGLLAFPEYPHGDTEQRAWLTAAVQSALGVDIGDLDCGDSFLLRVQMGNGRIEGAFMARSSREAPARGSLGIVAKLGDWFSLDSPPEMAQLREYLPAARIHAGLPTATQTRWAIAEDFWQTCVEDLANSSGTTEILTLVHKPQPIGSLALSFAERRRDRVARPRRPDDMPAAPLAGEDAYSVRLFLGGSGAGVRSLQQRWLETTGTDLVPAHRIRRFDYRECGLEAQIQMLLTTALTVAQATQMLPVPLIDSHSAIAAPRHRYHAHQHAPETGDADIIVGVTDAGLPVGLPADTVNQHVVVFGDTGYGKSTTVGGLLHQAWTRFGIPFLVIDPLKDEYAKLQVSGPGGRGQRPVRHLSIGSIPINPLAVPSGVAPEVFAAIMCQAFDSTSDLGDAYPLGAAVAQAAFDRLYLETSTPTMADLFGAFMAETHRGDMVGENGRNVRASLSARLRAITGGAAGTALAGGALAGINWNRLAEEPTVISFAETLPETALSTIYAFLIADHSAWRQANPTAGRHIVVLEEAELVFGRDNKPADALLQRLLATMRATGQGYAVVSQRPDQLSTLASSLFPNIITHRLLNTQGLGLQQALGVDDNDLSDLERGEALVRVGLGSARATRVRALTPPLAAWPGRDSHEHVPNYRAEELVTPSQPHRPWCDECPRPCAGRDWLQFRPQATAAARKSHSLDNQIVSAMRAAQQAATAAGYGRPKAENLYCVAASSMAALYPTQIDTLRAIRRVRVATDSITTAARQRRGDQTSQSDDT